MTSILCSGDHLSLIPACFSMLFTVPIGMSRFGCGTVSLPFFVGCLICLWLRTRFTSCQPAFCNCSMTSRLCMFARGVRCLYDTHFLHTILVPHPLTWNQLSNRPRVCLSLANLAGRRAFDSCSVRRPWMRVLGIQTGFSVMTGLRRGPKCPTLSPRRRGGHRQSRLLVIADGRSRSIEFRDIDRERLVVGAGTVLQDAEPHLLPQLKRRQAGTAEVDAGVNSVPKRNVVPQLGQLSVDGQAVSIGTRIRHEREAIRAWLVHVRAHCLEQRPNSLASVEEEFQRRDARATDGSMACRVAWVGRRTLWERLGQQVRAVLRVDDG